MPLSDVLLRGDSLRKLVTLRNPHVLKQVREFIDLCKPSRVTVITDDPEEIEYVRKLALDPRGSA